MRRCKAINIFTFISIGVLVVFVRNANQPENQRAGEEVEKSTFLVLTMVNKESSDFKRFLRSTRMNGLPLKVLGLGHEYKGWGEKVHWLIKEMEHHKNDSRKIVMFTDGFDVLFNAGVDQILQKFHRFNARVVFSGTRECYPMDLLPRYPPGCDLQYVNSGLFIGYAPEIYRILTHSHVKRDGNDQRFYAVNYIQLRDELNIKIDTRADLFHTLYFAEDDVELQFQGKDVVIYNRIFNTTPVAVHANGYAKLFIKSFGNYIPQTWNPVDGCLQCLEDTKDLGQLQEMDYPTVVIGLFITKRTPSLEQFFATISQLDYPKKKISIFIGNMVREHAVHAELFRKAHSHEYLNMTYQHWTEKMARTSAIYECYKKKCEFYFSVDSNVRLDNAQTLKLLIEQNRPMVAPMLKHVDSDSWNFKGTWPSEGLVSSAKHKYGFYPPYMDIIKHNRRGLWIVPFVSSCYLIEGNVIHRLRSQMSFERDDYQPEIAFNMNLYDADVDRLVSNRVHFGHLVP